MGEPPSLYRIDPVTFTIEAQFRLSLSDNAGELQLNEKGDKIFWLNNDVWCMDVTADTLPAEPFLASRDTKYYGLTIDPRNDEVYVADAIDYQQQGIIYRFSPDGTLLDEFFVGVIPGAFCWKL